MKNLFLIVFVICSISLSYGQDDLEALLESETEETVEYTSATFKNTRLLNGHSIEKMRPNDLEFRISHRFGTVNSGAYELWGLDQAHIHLGFDYGVNNWLNIGVGRGTSCTFIPMLVLKICFIHFSRYSYYQF